ncbi:MAG: winged helix-turn-helix transcriptional regulator [Chloroflexi bacterium]|nr:winged helix-turn-helix transcriptional regulator [Chloroflexota bacterium]
MWTQFHGAVKEVGLSVEGSAAAPDEARDLFDEVDEAIDILLEESDCQRLFFLIDDFDLLFQGVGKKISGQDLDWLRSLATRYSDSLAFVMSSSEALVTLTQRFLYRDTADARVSPFENMLHNRSLILLTRSEAEQLCRDTAVAEQQPPLAQADLDFLLAETGRHPALLKIGLRYFFEARQYETGDALYQDVRGDVRLDEHVHSLSRQLWERREPEAQAVLATLADQQSPDIDSILLTQLKKRLGLVEMRDGSLTIFADAVAYWLTRQEQSDGRESAPTPPEPINELTYLPKQRLVYLDEREVKLTPLEGRLLAYFLAHKNEVRTVEDLLNNVWGPGKTNSVVEKAVNRLRTKIEYDPARPRFILSARGEGYLLRLD